MSEERSSVYAAFERARSQHDDRAFLHIPPHRRSRRGQIACVFICSTAYFAARTVPPTRP
jgi:hypothetical protein